MWREQRLRRGLRRSFKLCEWVFLVYCTSFVMKILSWNVRGLGRSCKRKKIKELVRERGVDMVMLQETKRSEMSEQFVKSLWPWDYFNFLLVDAIGSTGGLFCIWKPEVFAMVNCCFNRSFILLSGIYGSFFHCVVVNVYGPNDAAKRRLLWEVLGNLRDSFHYPWCLGGEGTSMKSDLLVREKGV